MNRDSKVARFIGGIVGLAAAIAFTVFELSVCASFIRT